MNLFDDVPDDELVRRHEERLRASKNTDGKLGLFAVKYYQTMARVYWKEIEYRGESKCCTI